MWAWVLNSKAARIVGLAVLFVLAILGYGEHRERGGKVKAGAARDKANLKAAQNAKEIRNELDAADDQRLIDILSGKLR